MKTATGNQTTERTTRSKCAWYFNSVTEMLKVVIRSGQTRGKTIEEIVELYFNGYEVAYIDKVKRALEKKDPTYLESHIGSTEAKVETKKADTKDLHHFAFQKIVDCLSVKENVMLIGASGSGKTTCAAKAAKHLNLNFYCMSVGAQTSKTDFMGYMNAAGGYVATHFRTAYEFGGLFLIDEIDAGNGGIMTIINAALGNEVCGFPDKMVEKHKDFRCVAAANTFGKGADRIYIGRNPLDGATLNRFVKKDFDYDEKLESKLATNQEWFKLVISIRRVVEEKKLRILVTPRATFSGCSLLTTGMSYWEALELTLFNGLTKDELLIITTEANLSKNELSNKTTC